jgi:hypothetical protein
MRHSPGSIQGDEGKMGFIPPGNVCSRRGEKGDENAEIRLVCAVDERLGHQVFPE